MITAIPIEQDRIANHFTKASQFVFYDQQGNCIATVTNPALDANCTGKEALITLLEQQNTRQIIVRNIGERMLAKLLACKFVVLQAKGAPMFPAIVQNLDQCQPLTEASQGRPSHHFAKSGCAAHHPNHDANHSCQHHHHSGTCCHDRPHDGKRRGCCHH
ncbi:MAG: NifB/NifX family molybdenum-iron cluster-binding protein [Vibrio sp.]|uniref:NifB/NifX family molybdenum-iron cluster-binding protein n=1 Tax=Vibrio sp. TaxID=678 RepID=UPI003A8A75FC